MMKNLKINISAPILVTAIVTSIFSVKGHSKSTSVSNFQNSPATVNYSEESSTFRDFFGDNWSSSLAILSEDDINQNHQVNYPNNWASLVVAKKTKRAQHEAFIDFAGKVSLDKNKDFKFSLAEAYYKNKTSYGDFSLGRKLVKWNDHEKYWSLGHTNGVQGFSLIDEKREGLIGLHHDYGNRKNGFFISSFFSYFYIPTMNPGLNIENGEVSSSDRWSRVPPQSTEVFGKVVDIEYNMSEIDYAAVVLNKSIGFDLGYSWGSGKISSYAAYKPESGVRVNAEGYYDADKEKVVVTANPTVNHHLVMGTFVSQQMGDIEISGGVDVTDPNAKIGEDFEVLDPLELEKEKKIFESEFLTIMPNYERESYAFFKTILTQDKYKLTFNYIHNILGTDRGSDDFFSDTNRWDRAVGLKLQHKVSEKLNYLADYKFDFGRKDTILRTELNYQIRKQLGLLLGLEIINSPNRNSFWSFFRENDVVYSAFSYNW